MNLFKSIVSKLGIFLIIILVFQSNGLAQDDSKSPTVVFSYGHNRDREESTGIGDDSYDSPNYPVAWAFDDHGARRPMITLGSYRVGDLKADYFQNFFYNSVFWVLGYEVPDSGVLSAGKNFKMIKESAAYKPKKKSIPALSKK